MGCFPVIFLISQQAVSIWLWLALWGNGVFIAKACLLPNNLMMNKRTSIWSPGLCVVCCYISQPGSVPES